MTGLLIRCGIVVALAGGAIAWQHHLNRKQAPVLPPMRPMPPRHPDRRCRLTQREKAALVDIEKRWNDVGMSIFDQDERRQP